MQTALARTAILLGLALGGLGCGPAPSPEKSAHPAPSESPAVPRAVDGGELVLPIDADPATLNFVSGTDVYQALVARYVADGLLAEGRDLAPVPRLARSWEFNEDGKVLTFRLRSGVRWHDGTPFTAHDVIFTYRKIMDPSNRAKRELFRDVADVSAPDELTLRIVYREATVTALGSWMFPILPEHRFREGEFADSPLHQAPVGTGPYRFVSWTRGREIILEANDEYFLGRPHLDRIVLKVIPSRATQFQALLTGDTDWSTVPPEEWEARSADPDFRRRFRLFRYPTLYLYYIAWNQATPFFQDRRVRQAMTLSLDREGYVEKVYRGAGSPAASTFHPLQFGHDPSLLPLPFDPEQAGRLLDEAGWRRDPVDGIRRKGGRAFRFSLMLFQGNPVQEQIATLLQEGLAGNGVQVELRILDWPALLERLRGSDYEAALSGWLLDSDPDPTAFFHSDPELGTSNYVGYAEPEIDRLLLDGRRAYDLGRRREIYYRIQAILHRDQPYTFLFFPLQSVAVDVRFHGIELSPAGLLRWYPALLDWYVPMPLQRRGSLKK